MSCCHVIIFIRLSKLENFSMEISSTKRDVMGLQRDIVGYPCCTMGYIIMGYSHSGIHYTMGCSMEVLSGISWGSVVRDE